MSGPKVAYWLAGLCIIQFAFLLLHNVPGNTGRCTTFDVVSDKLQGKQGPHYDHTSLSTSVQQPLRQYHELPTGSDGEYTDNLSDAQCDLAFPDLYKQVDRAVEYWRARSHRITPDDVNVHWAKGSAIRLLIHDNQLRILEGDKAFGPMQRSRVVQSMFLIYRALESATAAGEKVPDIEFSILVPDIVEMPDNATDTHTIWHWNRHIGVDSDERHWLMPNFDMWRGQGKWTFRQARILAKEKDQPFKEKIPKIVWRGAKWVNRDVRGSLLDVTKGKSWADVEDVSDGHTETYIDNHELCKYAMTVHTEGISYSGRFKWLAACNSLIFVHELSWDLFYYHLMVPEGPKQNVVMVKRDFSDLEEKVNYYLAHPDEAEKIIANSLATFRERYLTRAAVSCYTRRLIKGYSEVSFKPAIVQEGHAPFLRGHPFEAFINAPFDGVFDAVEGFV